MQEKTTHTALIYDVSPLRFGEYLAAKLGVLSLVSMVMVVPAPRGPAPQRIGTSAGHI